MVAHEYPTVEVQLTEELDRCAECLNREDYDGAWQALCRALSLAPQNAELLSHRGHLALFLKRAETAQRDFAEALRINPRFAAAWAGMARYHFVRNERPQALSAAERALAVEPTNETALQVKADLGQSKPLPKVVTPPASAPAETRPVPTQAECDALRQALHGPFSTQVGTDALRFEHRLPPVTDRQGARVLQPPVLMFPPYFFRPLNVRVDPALAGAPRLNILLPSISAAHNSGGPNTVYLLAAELARAGVPLRIVAVNMPADRDDSSIRAHIARISGVSPEVVARIELLDANDRTNPVSLGENDVFLATAWWTAQMIKYLLPRFRQPRFIYVIQDYEPNLHPISTNSMLALETYGLNQLAVVNSRLLFDHFVTDRVGRFADPEFVRESCWFEPAVDRGLYHADSANPARSGKRRLLFYARPDSPRNLLELGVAALMQLLEQGGMKPEEWDFHATVIGVGGSCRPVQLCADGKATLVPLPLHELPTWAAEMRRTDILLSLIWSPHTSYPVLEGAASGATVVTNTCGVKTADRLRQISSNILAGAPTIEGVAEALAAAAARASDWPARLAGTALGLPATWRDSFAPVLPRLLNFLNGAGIHPP
ncbi:MAG TPA: hypothetical protein VHI52_23270 [Verrucomicrobiae bacterium]|nr:hypothetical protein [Verrucomicrobiae bacterium]